jgi:tetratricopeptide (TPR) repeat protein
MAESFLMELHYGYTTFNRVKDSLEYYTEKATNIDPEQGILYSLKGDMAFWSFDFKIAFDLYQKAIDLNPNYPNSHYYQGVIYLNSNYFDEGLMKIDKAINLDPLNGRYLTMKPLFLLRAGRTEEALNLLNDMYEEKRDDNTTLFMMGMIYTVMKEYEKAVNILLKRSVGHNTNWLLAYNYAKTGQTIKAKKILDYMLQLPEDRSPPPTLFAIVYLGFDEYGKAITYMDKALETNDLWFTWVDYSWSDPVRDDPRYIEIVNSFDIGLD